MLSPKGFNKFNSDSGLVDCCGKQSTKLANEIQTILDELEAQTAAQESLKTRPQESAELEDFVVDSGSTQSQSPSQGKGTNCKKRKRSSAVPSVATSQSVSPDDMQKSCEECQSNF